MFLFSDKQKKCRQGFYSKQIHFHDMFDSYLEILISVQNIWKICYYFLDGVCLYITSRVFHCLHRSLKSTLLMSFNILENLISLSETHNKYKNTCNSHTFELYRVKNNEVVFDITKSIFQVYRRTTYVSNFEMFSLLLLTAIV